jgi:hypothetical protein
MDASEDHKAHGKRDGGLFQKTGHGHCSVARGPDEHSSPSTTLLEHHDLTRLTALLRREQTGPGITDKVATGGPRPPIGYYG